MFNNISDKVQKIIKDSVDNSLTLVDNKKSPVKFNQRDTINRIESYINDRYVERGDDAIFWNISNSRITHFAKLIGVDTKDFMPYGIGEYNMFQSWALKKMVRKWFNDNEFYKTLNDISEGLATYGSVVWKKCKENGETHLEEVDLKNLYFDQSVKEICETDVVELHELSHSEIWEKENIWENFSEFIEKVKDIDKPEVWEFFGWFAKGTEKPEFKHVIGYGYGADYIELWSEDVDEEADELYFDFHIGRYRGRWLRTGVVERLFKLQERANQLVNQNAQATEIATLLLFQSANGDLTGNLLEQAANGQIIGDDTLKQIGISNTGLVAFIDELRMIESQANTLCLTPDIIQGENSPSNTTFRGIAVVSSSAKSAFTAYLQDLGEGIARILINYIFPEQERKWAKEPFIEIAEDESDIEMYDKAMLEWMKKEYLLKTGPVTPEVEAQIKIEMEDKLKMVGRKVVPEKGWINFKWGIKMMPTNESVDKTTMNDAYFNALNMIGANPSLVNIPLFKQYLEDNGITWTKLSSTQQQQLMQQAQGGQMPEQRKPDALMQQANAQ